MTNFTIAPSDPALRWEGCVELEHAETFSRGWRLPRRELTTYASHELRDRAVMQSGVRVRLCSDTDVLSGYLVPLRNGALAEAISVDLSVDGVVLSAPLTAEGRFDFASLGKGKKSLELWLPLFGEVGLGALGLAEDAVLFPVETDPSRQRLAAYGSSITHGRGADCPTGSWPAILARRLGMDLINLGFGGQCHLDPVAAHTVRDLDADVITLCLGINIYGASSFSARSLPSAIQSFLQTVRDRHAETPLVVVSPIAAPPREKRPNAVGLTLENVRAIVLEASQRAALYSRGPMTIVDGLRIMNVDEAVELLPDGLHPHQAGYELMASRLQQYILDAINH